MNVSPSRNAGHLTDQLVVVFVDYFKLCLGKQAGSKDSLSITAVAWSLAVQVSS